MSIVGRLQRQPMVLRLLVYVVDALFVLLAALGAFGVMSWGMGVNLLARLKKKYCSF